MNIHGDGKHGRRNEVSTDTLAGWEGIWRGQYKFDDLDRMLNLGNVAMSDIR